MIRDGNPFKPVSTDKGEPVWDNAKLTRYVASDVKTNPNYFQHRAKQMNTQDLQDAQELIEQYTKTLSTSMEKLVEQENALSETSKKVSGRLRDSSQKLADGLARVEKIANFDRLERYATLLERIAASLESLAKLEESGVLQKVSGALK